MAASRSPGAVLLQYQDGRNAHLVAGMYLYFSRDVFDRLDIPILYSGVTVEPVALRQWFRTQRPDVIVYADHDKHFRSLEAFSKSNGSSSPCDLSLAVIDASVHPDGISGVRQNAEQMGISAVDMLLSRLQQGETGLPKLPKVECVEGDWIEGTTLRAL